jgi:hypothetical protein
MKNLTMKLDTPHVVSYQDIKLIDHVGVDVRRLKLDRMTASFLGFSKTLIRAYLFGEHE